MSITIQQAIKHLSIHLRSDDDCYKQAVAKGYYTAAEGHKRDMEVNQMAIDALREKAEREDPKPLTLEELRQMDGDPVWIIAKHHVIYADVVKIQGKEDGDAFIGFEINHRLQENGYGKTWLAYLNKPQNPCKTCLCWEKCLGVDTGCLWINRNEERLIDANALLENSDVFTMHTKEYGSIEVIPVDAVGDAPTVDAVAVPCKMGDEVWGLKKYRSRLIPEKGVVYQMYFGDDMRLCICVKNVCRGEWGKNVFATKEEADVALAKMDGGNEDG